VCVCVCVCMSARATVTEFSNFEYPGVRAHAEGNMRNEKNRVDMDVKYKHE
jgi:hypothetical protein